MKKYLFFFLTAIVLSCSKKELIETQKKEITDIALNYLNNNIIENGFPDKIDSLKLIRIDSVTESHQVLLLTNFITYKFKKFNNEQEKILNDMRLYSNIDASDLMEIRNSDYNKIKDSFNYYNNIFEKIKNKKTDSIKVLNYYATLISKSHNIKTNVARQDSIYIIFNNQNQIITEKEYIKQLILKFSK